MKPSQVILIVSFHCLLVLHSTDAQVKKCTKKDLARIDTLGALITTFGKYGRRFPEDRAQLDVYCREMKSQLKELEILVKGCYEGQTKQFMSIVVFSFRNVVKNSCGKKAERRFKDLMAMGKCSNFKNSTISSCLTNYIEKLQGTLQAKQDKRLPLVCCDYYKFLGCLNDQVRPTCPNQSESILDLIRNIFQGIVDVACGDYTENSDKCESIIATPKKPNGAPFFKSFVVPLSSVWASL